MFSAEFYQHADQLGKSRVIRVLGATALVTSLAVGGGLLIREHGDAIKDTIADQTVRKFAPQVPRSIPAASPAPKEINISSTDDTEANSDFDGSDYAWEAGVLGVPLAAAGMIYVVRRRKQHQQATGQEQVPVPDGRCRLTLDEEIIFNEIEQNFRTTD